MVGETSSVPHPFLLRKREGPHPTGSSWINQVERWFGYLTDQLLRRGVHTSVAALEKDVPEWITDWNENPKPFAWTKNEDEILNSLAKYIERISGAGH